jgi:hypothetical protein
MVFSLMVFSLMVFSLIYLLAACRALFRSGPALHAGAASLPKVYSKSVVSSGRQVKIASYAALLSGCEEFPFLV